MGLSLVRLCDLCSVVFWSFGDCPRIICCGGFHFLTVFWGNKAASFPCFISRCMLHRDNEIRKSDWLLCVLPCSDLLSNHIALSNNSVCLLTNFCCFLPFLSWLMGTMATMMMAMVTMTKRAHDCKQQTLHGGTRESNRGSKNGCEVTWVSNHQNGRTCPGNNVIHLKSVGEKTAEIMNKHGITTVEMIMTNTPDKLSAMTVGKINPSTFRTIYNKNKDKYKATEKPSSFF